MSGLLDTDTPSGRILTLDEVAELVQLSTRTIYRAILAGDLEASQLTQRRGGWRVYESALADWMRKRSNRTRPPRPLADVRPVEPDELRAPPTIGRLSAGGRLSVGPHMGRGVA
jgi:excisionase family DNA binding protein